MDVGQTFWFLIWRIRDADSTLRYRYPLTARSVVWDVGGYVGEWSESINGLYHPQITVFEPMAKYSKLLKVRFSDVPNIAVKPYGLSNKDQKVFFSPAGIGSSQYKRGKEPAVLKDVAKEMRGKIDLLKMNIEGGEYDVLERLIATGKIKDIRYLQIQFHKFVPDSKLRYKNIASALRITHKRMYRYPWLWESWERR